MGQYATWVASAAPTRHARGVVVLLLVVLLGAAGVPARAAVTDRHQDAGPAPAASVTTARAAEARLPTALADGLAEESHSRYVFDRRSQTVRVSVTTTIRNARPDVGLRYFYWDTYGVPVPAGAEDVRAVSGGTGLPVRFEPSEDPFTRWAMVSFAPLRYGRSMTIGWSYTIPGEPIRSESYTRVGRGYATFAAQTPGDPGAVSVEVIAPEGMEFTGGNARFREEDADGRRRWVTTEATDEFGIWSPVSLRDPDATDRTRVDVGGEELLLLSFPGDRRWTAFVRERLAEGLPVVEETIGQEWPGGLREIREDVSPEVLGFAWYDGGRKEIVVGEDLDAQLFYHELIHTWVNGGSLEGRWLVEGVTEAVARRVVERTGGVAEREDVARDAPDALPLTTWGDLSPRNLGEADRGTEEYAYAAAPATVERLTGDLDDEAFADLVSALLEGESAYERPGERAVYGRADWRRLLDLAEDRAGVRDAARVLRTWALTEKQGARLAQRAEARKMYRALDEADGGWRPPQGLRARMTAWEFAAAGREREALGDAPAAARRVQAAAAAGGFAAPTAVRDAYESAAGGHDYREAVALLPRAADATEQVSAVVQDVGADRGLVTELGETVLLTGLVADGAVRSLDAGDVEEASGGAELARRLVGSATAAGVGVIVLLAGTAVSVILLAGRARRRWRFSPNFRDARP